MLGYKEYTEKTVNKADKAEDQIPTLNVFADTMNESIMSVHDKFATELSKIPDNASLLYRIYKKNNEQKNPVEEASLVSNKVMETWLNQTLTEAEHLDIPGVILKPEHKNPISRYGIDRMELTNNGIPNEMVDRIYRCLFVYSVGFYNMIGKVI